MPKKSTKSLLELFKEKYIEDESGCWLWTGRLTPRGYGTMHNPTGGSTRANRMAYELFVGPIGDGLAVCHRCDVRRCVNPAHLFLGTWEENNRDRDAKGRTAIGSRASQAKLTEEQVEKVKELLKEGQRQTDIARKFGVSKTTIWDIAHKRWWRHVA